MSLADEISKIVDKDKLSRNEDNMTQLKMLEEVENTLKKIRDFP
jgi:hypothetical protein